MLAETMATALRKENEGCFTCGDKNHLKRDCPKKANKRPPKICPHCRKGMHWAKKTVNLNLILKENLFQKTLKQGTPPPGPLQPKPGANSIFSLKPSTSSNAAIDIPALNDFLLYPQAVPFRIPTRLFGPLPPTNIRSFTWPIQFDF